MFHIETMVSIICINTSFYKSLDVLRRSHNFDIEVDPISSSIESYVEGLPAN